jgi:TRAP-type C4-dicarboxylate transport system substrate-binding protein
MRVRIAGTFATQHSSSVAIEGVKREVGALTMSRLSVDTFPAMQLGSAGENVSNECEGPS